MVHSHDIPADIPACYHWLVTPFRLPESSPVGDVKRTKRPMVGEASLSGSWQPGGAQTICFLVQITPEVV